MDEQNDPYSSPPPPPATQTESNNKTNDNRRGEVAATIKEEEEEVDYDEEELTTAGMTTTTMSTATSMTTTRPRIPVSQSVTQQLANLESDVEAKIRRFNAASSQSRTRRRHQTSTDTNSSSSSSQHRRPSSSSSWSHRTFNSGSDSSRSSRNNNNNNHINPNTTNTNNNRPRKRSSFRASTSPRVQLNQLEADLMTKNRLQSFQRHNLRRQNLPRSPSASNIQSFSNTTSFRRELLRRRHSGGRAPPSSSSAPSVTFSPVTTTNVSQLESTNNNTTNSTPPSRQRPRQRLRSSSFSALSQLSQLETDVAAKIRQRELQRRTSLTRTRSLNQLEKDVATKKFRRRRSTPTLLRRSLSLQQQPSTSITPTTSTRMQLAQLESTVAEKSTIRRNSNPTNRRLLLERRGSFPTSRVRRDLPELESWVLGKRRHHKKKRRSWLMPPPPPFIDAPSQPNLVDEVLTDDEEDDDNLHVPLHPYIHDDDDDNDDNDNTDNDGDSSTFIFIDDEEEIVFFNATSSCSSSSNEGTDLRKPSMTNSVRTSSHSNSQEMRDQLEKLESSLGVKSRIVRRQPSSVPYMRRQSNLATTTSTMPATDSSGPLTTIIPPDPALMIPIVVQEGGRNSSGHTESAPPIVRTARDEGDVSYDSNDDGRDNQHRGFLAVAIPVMVSDDPSTQNSVVVVQEDQDRSVVGMEGFGDEESVPRRAHEDDVAITAATEYHPRPKSPWYWNRRCQLFGCMAVVSVGLVGWILSRTLSSGGGDPLLPNLRQPTNAPSTFREGLGFEEALGSLLDPEMTDPAALGKAFNWIVNEDPMQLVPEEIEHLRHRFILATLYFSTAGDAWDFACKPSAVTDECDYALVVETRPWDTEAQTFRWLSGEHECRWAGIACDSNNRTQGVQLIESNLEGTFPKILTQLSHLEKLFLSRNALYGTLPSNWTNWQQLKIVELCTCRLTGTISPGWFRDVPSLQTLVLEGNNLNGTIPSEIAMSTSLGGLFLSDNELSGTIPSELANMVGLQTLRVSINFLTGTLPSELGKMFALRELSAGKNLLSGSIPSEIGRLRLLDLRLHRNKLTGTIPESIFSMRYLQRIDLYDSFLNGTISTRVGSMRSMQVFRIRGNRMTGTLPTEFGRLLRLSEVWLQFNSFVGSVPSQLCDLRGPTRLALLEADCGPSLNDGPPLVECVNGCCTACCGVDEFCQRQAEE